MLLLVAATELEMEPVRQLMSGRPGIDFLATGLGPVEAAFSLTKYLPGAGEIALIINFGVAGAFLGTGIHILDVCLAAREYLGELGICLTGQIDDFSSPDLTINKQFSLTGPFFERAKNILATAAGNLHSGNFVTVAGVSGTAERGNILRDKYQAICENMEGAAIARVAGEYGIACLEVRVISNMVEDRDPAKWRISDAVKRSSDVVSCLIEQLPWK